MYLCQKCRNKYYHYSIEILLIFIYNIYTMLSTDIYEMKFINIQKFISEGDGLHG